MNESDRDSFEGWMVLELMGHRKMAGYVREVTVAGAGFLRIDVPGPDKTPVATQFYPPSSVYCMTPTTEAMARALARRCQPEPVHSWELPAPRPIIVPDRGDDEDLDDAEMDPDPDL